jgi:tetratricopeptide (TPR) repeat protein
MRPLSASNVPHTSQTDHRILRRSDAKGAVRPTGEMELFDHAETRLAPLDLARARGLMQAQIMLRHPDAASIARLEAQLRSVIDQYPDDVDVLMVLGTLSVLQQHPSDAREFWQTILRIRGEHEGALLQLAKLENQAGHTAEALELLQRYSAIDPWQADLHGSLGQLLWNAGRREQAVDTATEGLQLDPRLVPLRRWLAGALRQLGRVDEADVHERTLKRMRGR